MLDFMKAALFDLDGVIVDTAKYHFRAWQELATGLGILFTEKDNEELKGVSRMESLEIILRLGHMKLDDARKRQLAEQKNESYVRLIRSIDASEALPGAVDYIRSLRARGVLVGLGSASKNARLILQRLSIEELFDCIIDGTRVSKSKPDPEVFLLGARELRVPEAACVVFEDSRAGLEAAKRAGMYAVGIGEAEVLTEADMVVWGLGEFMSLSRSGV